MSEATRRQGERCCRPRNQFFPPDDWESGRQTISLLSHRGGFYSFRRIVPDRMNNSSLRNFEDAPSRLNTVCDATSVRVRLTCASKRTRVLCIAANFHGISRRGSLPRLLSVARCSNLDVYISCLRASVSDLFLRRNFFLFFPFFFFLCRINIE